jgi:hypothetical protein
LAKVDIIFGPLQFHFEQVLLYSVGTMGEGKEYKKIERRQTETGRKTHERRKMK